MSYCVKCDIDVMNVISDVERDKKKFGVKFCNIWPTIADPNESAGFMISGVFFSSFCSFFFSGVRFFT